MLAVFARNWWIVALRGVLAIIFGILTLFWPLLTLQALIVIFGVYLLVEGIFAVIGGMKTYGNRRSWAVLLRGIVGIMAGLIVFVLPDITTVSLLYVIAGWALGTGLLEIVAANQLGPNLPVRHLMILGGMASVIFALILFLFPGPIAVSMTWVISAYAVAIGILLIILGFTSRSHLLTVGTAMEPADGRR
jgi:uncharacterized membrane protein HdeD (DUF308 family)